MVPFPTNNKSNDTMVLSFKKKNKSHKNSACIMKPEDMLMFWADKEPGWRWGKTKVLHHTFQWFSYPLRKTLHRWFSSATGIRLYCNTTFHTWVLYLNGSSEVRLGEAQPEHASNSHTNTQPGKEAEEIDDREDVLRDGVQHGQQTLIYGKRKTTLY